MKRTTVAARTTKLVVAGLIAPSSVPGGVVRSPPTGESVAGAARPCSEGPRPSSPEGVGVSTPAMRTLDPIPSTRSSVTVDVVADLPGADEVGAVAVPVAEGAEPPADLGQDAAALAAAGFTGKRGQTIVLPGGGRALVAVGIVTLAEHSEAVVEGVRRGEVLARAAALGRDLANCPAAALTATRIGEVAQELGPPAGLEVEVVGKGIMYDSGGISIKPSDESHAQMKNDMTGAATVLAAMTALRDAGCQTEVTGYLMCTDNMPSGSALKLGDVLRMRNGKTVEVLNTDAEGRLVMADALALAVELDVDAIVDIATLTGACLRALGVDIAGVMGNSDALVDQVRAAGEVVDEPVWPLPLHRRYRSQLDSPIADMTNLGGPNAGQITAALFLEEFVGDKPWAHIDIAGTAQLPEARGWRNKGATAFGSRLLVELACAFERPSGSGAGSGTGS